MPFNRPLMEMDLIDNIWQAIEVRVTRPGDVPFSLPASPTAEDGGTLPQSPAGTFTLKDQGFDGANRFATLVFTPPTDLLRKKWHANPFDKKRALKFLMQIQGATQPDPLFVDLSCRKLPHATVLSLAQHVGLSVVAAVKRTFQDLLPAPPQPMARAVIAEGANPTAKGSRS